MKRLAFILTVMMGCQIVFGQLKVVQNGNVGIGTNNPQQKLQVEGNTYLTGDVGIGTNTPQQKLHVDGNTYLNGNVGIGTNNPLHKLQVNGTTYLNGNVGIGITYPQYQLHINGEFCMQYGTYSPLRISLGNSGPGIGSNADRINMWSDRSGFNKVSAQKYDKVSDSTIKEDIQPFTEGLNIITQLNTYSYFFKDDSSENRKREFGLLAQEVEALLPELVDTSYGLKLLDYDQFIPFLINAIKEQQIQIEEKRIQIEMLQQMLILQETDLIQLRDEMMVLRADLDRCCEGEGLYRGDTLINYNDTTTGNNPVLNEPVLYQNIPNPFNTDTRISYYLPATVQTAYLYIYNLNGTQLKSYTLTLRGVQAVTVYASELPAGMYLYTLVVDNVIIDSKRMILTK
ncbi:MAG: T9SS type A sorting domain-containing protein [Bacteroidales bacterium]|jgi:hypothetical protein|nr:T9SS type A sorting domain-containing protein [Bacteroidales bacterium]OQA91780.1 MAG: hypothetical protein BWY27_00505 [Bacteroidetes bacterium ADurb.Bin234]